MIKKIVLSLDTFTGKGRRDLLNYEYVWFKASGPDEILPEVKSKMCHKMHNISDKMRLGKEATLSSYINLFTHIYENKIDNVILLEDDCILKDAIPTKEELGNEPIYLNGVIFPTTFNEMRAGFEKDLMSKLDLKFGINDIDYFQFRIFGILGLYLPNHTHAKQILDYIRSCNKYSAVDNMIVKSKLVNHFFYPAVFRHEDHGHSQIRLKYKKFTKEYFSNYIL